MSSLFKLAGGRSIVSVEDMSSAARDLHALCNSHRTRIREGLSEGDLTATALDARSLCVLVKGGHLPAVHGASDNVAVDVFYDGRDLHYLLSPRLAVGNTHGTGAR